MSLTLDSDLVLRVAPTDNVAVALADLPADTRLTTAAADPLHALEAVGRGHKLALMPISAGDIVRKFGFPIGRASVDIAAGAWVHSHNLSTGLSGASEYHYDPVEKPAATAVDTRQFLGYPRGDGRVGTRNEIWILCTVGCVANTARRIAEKSRARFDGRVDGIHAITHPFGCSQLGDDLDNTRSILAALARHPNAGGVLIVGLGCESLQMSKLIGAMDGIDPRRLRYFNAQQSADETADGIAAVDALVQIAEADRRVTCPLSALSVGLKCGGSDGFSGITANPLVGRIADRVGAAGGTPILTEIPEIFGAEHLLMERASDVAVFDAIGAVVNDFKRYFESYGQPVHENPSPGNKAGGITTLEEKSLGAVQKGGHGTVTQVLRYGERASRNGLILLEAPGNDAVSSTALVAAGATVLLFTTGRGTPLGFPVPTLKIASNSALANAKPGWIDFDAGAVLSRGDVDAVADDLLDLVIATASGQLARNEINDEREIAIWKNGVTL